MLSSGIVSSSTDSTVFPFSSRATNVELKCVGPPGFFHEIRDVVEGGKGWPELEARRVPASKMMVTVVNTWHHCLVLAFPSACVTLCMRAQACMAIAEVLRSRPVYRGIVETLESRPSEVQANAID